MLIEGRPSYNTLINDSPGHDHLEEGEPCLVPSLRCTCRRAAGSWSASCSKVRPVVAALWARQ
ncbi:hypothetical protein E2C01_064554 [Portunus trituberculatus]|uniref:Uncharacterized protein n=1 Tax=Portunus trituberculatus TaxID=210409 RepID=A0A5B7HDB4_PORTR|nr:hypothetical protein [Portunus trituberculatus]